MKRILLALTMFAFVLSAAPRSEAEADVSIDFFYDNLGDDGSWVEVGDYGYCWQPTAAVSNSNWRPYSDGYWAYTDVGWTWVSYESFGWATYHYGRWARLRDQGWVWVPGTEWGPAWVSWRTGGDYVGWAPLPPRYSEGGGELVYEGRPINGRVDIDFDIGPAYYNFVDVRYIGEPVLRERIFEPAQNIAYINRTVNVTNITYENSRVFNHGPDYNRLSAYSVRPIQRLRLQRDTNVDFSAAGRGNARTQVQGDQLMVSAPLRVQRPQRGSAVPRNVKNKIAKADFETGWMGVANPKAKADLQQKFKTEDRKSIPPPQIQPTNPAALNAASPATAPVANGATAVVADPLTAVSPIPEATPAGKGKERNKRDLPNQPADRIVTPQDGAVQSGAIAAPGSEPKSKGKKRGQPEQSAQPIAPTAEDGSVPPQPTAVPVTPKEDRKGKGKRGVPQQPAIAPVTPEPGAPAVSDPAPQNDQPKRDVSPANPNESGKRQQLRTTNGGQRKAGRVEPVTAPEAAAAPAAQIEAPANPPVAPERKARGPARNPQQQVAPSANAPAAAPAGGEGQAKPAKGKKNKKGDEPPPPPAPGQ